MSDFNKKVNNPLFSSAVTGGTFEDFSQNALLLPAKEKPPPPPPVNLVQENPSEFLRNPNILEEVPTNIESFHPQPYESSPNNFSNYFNSPSTQAAFDQQSELEQVNLGQPQPQSNISSVFSSFSNILKLGGPQKQPIVEEETVSAPAGLDTIPYQPPENIAPVPLFSADTLNQTVHPVPSSSATPLNTYRRTGLKRPVYAPVPGLSAQPPQQTPFQTPPQGLLPQQPQQTPGFNYFPQPPLITTPTPPPNHFKHIPPQPTTFLVPEPTSVSAAAISPAIPFSSSNLQSPVMAAIPANELLQTPHINSGSSLTPNFNIETLPPNAASPNQVYRPVYHHWFHRKEIEGKVIWQPFSMVDSLALDEAFVSADLDPDKVVSTDGGRFDVNILRRQRSPVYWNGPSTEVRRCSWFHKSADGRFVPYEENIATKLEDEFKMAFESNEWHRKVELPKGDTIVFHSPDVLALFPPTQSPDAWGNTNNQQRPRIVKRGMDEFDIDEGESATVDHLLFMVHGIGSVCDLKFRKVEEVVDDFRSISSQLVQSHYKTSYENGVVNRLEVLPISWHDQLHSSIDMKLKNITLESIPRLRDFTNDTLLDILFYSSPVYCQTIISAVANELNRIFELFKKRNPDFKGGVSLGGHSLGSLILFDLLCYQRCNSPKNVERDEDNGEGNDAIVADSTDSTPPPLERHKSRKISYMLSPIGTGQPQIQYPQLTFQPKALFAMGSPIGMFVTVRGLDTLGEQFALPTCPAFFNIFHPYDPVAYRIESLINPELSKLKPVLVPHHKGRKRMHLELKETMARVGADLKQRIVDSIQSTWNSFYQLAMFHRQDEVSLEAEVDKALQQQLRERQDSESEELEQASIDLPLGALNNNRRVDYVLQEAPFEIFNEYIFAMRSHTCYWESEDTILLVLKEIYSQMSISADDKIPQQSMTIERPTPPSSEFKLPSRKANDGEVGMDPTAPLQQNVQLGPPPISGFMKKT